MNRLEVFNFLESFFKDPGRANGTALKPFFDLVSSLKKNLPLSIPLLRDFSAFCADSACYAGGQKIINGAESIIKRRIDRRYLRLCRIQENLGKLDFKQAPPGVSPEDFIFSKIDFSRYREINEKDFELLFREGLEDFDETFFKKTFNHGRGEIQSEIERSYKKNHDSNGDTGSNGDDGSYRLQRENPLILSVMQNLETSLESLPLFTPEEIQGELKELIDFTGGSGRLRNTELLYPLLVHCLDGALVTHRDGMTTKLFIGPQGELAGTFRPGNKPWTRTLIPAE